jgi:hypothetical protein
MGDISSGISAAIGLFLFCAAFWGAVLFAVCRLLGWHPLSAVAHLVGL